MTTVNLLSLLRSHDIRLWVEDGQLRYSAPIGGLSDDLLAQIRENKIELLNLVKNTKRFRQALPLLPKERKGNPPLSFAQERLWVLHQLFPESPAYHNLITLRLAGSLNASALVNSLRALVARHESLRTSFPTIDNNPVQVIRDEVSLPLVQHDLRKLPTDECENRVSKLFEEEFLRPFNLTTGPVIRATLLQVADEEHLLLLVLHHIVTDGWSRGLLQRDLAALYTEQVTGQPAALPALPIQYADFALWQRAWLQGAVLEEQLAYWRKHLAGLEPLEFLTDRPRPPVQTYAGGSHVKMMGQEITGALQSLSRQEGVTFATTLLAAFQVLLARYTGQRDIAVGSPIANRTQPEVEQLIGFFVNTLVMRTDLSGDPTFREVLARVHEGSLEAHQHQDVPFERIVGDLQPERDPSRNPLFQVMFAVQNIPRADYGFHELTARPVSRTITTTRMDLECFVWEEEGELRVALIYNTDLFDSETIEQFGQHFQMILEEVVRNPAQRLSQISLLNEEDRQQLLVAWNDTATAYPREQSLPTLFEVQASTTPDAVAVASGAEQLTYGQLNQRANQLAHYLQRQGVGPEVRVGLCLERGADLIVSLLAILKAGGVYVPLDPGYPKERLAYMLTDAHPAVLLTQQSLLEDLPSYGGTLVCLDTAWPSLKQESPSSLRHAGTPDTLAYVIYTSGSTGRPKGAMISHRGICNHMDWMGQAFPLTEADCVIQKTPFSFDASVWEFFAPLLAGARLALAGRDGHRDPPYLIKFIAEQNVTVLQIVPTLFRQLLEQGLASCVSLQYVYCGGEVLPMNLSMQWRVYSPAKLINLYGPTETTIDVFFWDGPVTEDSAIVPVGRPVANTQGYVVDRYSQLAPMGVPGELYIGGQQVARGYLHQPALTAEKFVPHPFSQAPGARVYKTGDQVRWRDTGVLEFLGRQDTQIKLRGYRIELGEIEAVLRQQPHVQEAVVLCRTDSPGDKQLVAYVTTDSEPLNITALRAALQERLPGYMVPPAFVVLEQFPLTPNGKVNRRALPAPGEADRTTGTTYVVPRTPLEHTLVNIWQDVLSLQQVGVHDNFFDLGGHSLLATQVVSRVRAQLQVEVTLLSFFQRPTVAGLAQALEPSPEAPVEPRRPPLTPCARTKALPLSFAQQRLWFLHQLEPASPAYLMFSAFHLRGPLMLKALEASLQALVQRHEALRTTFPLVQDEPVQQIAPAWPVALTVIDLQRLSFEERDQETARLLNDDAQQPFELAVGPLFRCRVLKLGPEEHLLLLTLHHIISDGWSMGVFYRELRTAYTAICAGQPPALPALPIQYADYAVWQRAWLQGEVLQQQVGYWEKQLVDLTPLTLPTDAPRPARQTYRGASLTFSLPPAVVQGLTALSHQEGVTLFMTLLATFQVVLAKYTGQEDIALGSPIANRTQTELEGLIGFFVNTLVLRTRLVRSLSFRHLLHQVRETCLEAYAHQDVPFEKLVEVLQPVRDPSRHPLFQTMFQVQHANETAPFTLSNLQVTPFPSINRIAKFDLQVGWTIRGETMTAHVTFNTDLFTQTRMERFGRHYQRILEEVVRDPAQRLSQISLLEEEERQQQLIDWNDTATAYPEEQSLPQLFEAQVAECPEAVAVVCGDEQLTYAQLNQRANQLAHYLQRRGVEQEGRVGVCLQRGVDLIVSLLAILKNGAAYVPLDPTVPAERLGFLIKDAAVGLVLTQKGHEAWLPRTTTCVVILDEVGAALAHEPSTPVGVPVSSAQLAYIMYTSGSTGQPKGTLISQCSVVRLVKATNYAQLDARQRFLQLAPMAFDASTFEVWGSLLNGATLVVYPSGPLSVEDLGGVLETERISTVLLTAALFHQLVENQLAAFQGVQQVLAGGDVLAVGSVQRVLATLGANQWVINGYGPTENTTLTCCHSMNRDSQLEGTVPIGRPISNTQAYVLDQAQQLVPGGVPGELYAGGAGLAWGYVNQPALTAEKFIPHPFSQAPGARLYRTGDQVRWRDTGVLEFLGRQDTQIKLRGYRIELGEIEAVLRQQPHVQEAVVLCRTDSPGDKQLVAYVTTDSEPLNITALRAALQERLPGYMVPPAFVVLEQFPLTPNGKVNRRALPAPGEADRTTGTTYVAPHTPLEEAVAGIFQELLSLQQVGVHDNFFDLGGHSLLATQVVSRVRAQLQVEVTLLSFFQRPTVAGLAQALEPSPEAPVEPRRPPLTPCARTKALPLSFAQQRLWFLHQLEPASPAYLMFSAFHLRGPLMLKALEASLQALVQRHEALRTTFPLVQDEPVQQIAPAWPVALTVIDLQRLSFEERDQETARLLNDDAQQPFELAVGPLFRCRVLKLGPEEHLLLLTLHHIISDGWSMGVFYRELRTAYTAICAGQPPALPALPIQYADYAVWQRAWLQGEQLDRQLTYWREQLAGVPTLMLPTDFPRPAIQDYRGERVTLQVSPAITEKLKAVSRQAGATLFMTLLAAFQVVLQRWSGQDEVCIGIPSAGRTRQEIESVMGFFINTLVVRTDVSGQPTFFELLEQVRNRCLGAYAHQDVPFEKLVEVLQPARQLNRNPFFDVLFNFVGGMNTTFELPEVTIKKLSHGELESKFALTMYVAERENEIQGRLVYQRALFRAERMQALVAQYHQVLEQLVTTPERSIQSYSLVTDESRAWLPNPQARLEAPPQDSVLTCIHQWAMRAPDQVAVRHGTEILRYGELLSRSQACAQALRRQGVGADDVVALRGPRSSGLIVAVVGVWLAGGVILLLDPRLPPARQSVMREASGAQFLVEIGPVPASEPGTDDTFVPCLVVDAATGTVEPLRPRGDEPEPAWPAGAAEGPAYVFFTSGTTGVPKGILGSHQALAHFLAWQRETFAMSAQDRVAQCTGVSFDVILRDIFLPLTSGATVCLPPEEAGGHEQLAWLAAEQITVVHVVPSVASFWVAAIAAPIPLPALRWVFFAGEPLTDQLLAQWEAACPGPAQFVNLYGATETTLVKSWYLVPPKRVKGVQPVGQPLPQTQLLVMGEEHRLCGIGEVGELIIRTPFRSLGYLHANEDTPPRFVPNPYREDPTDVLYHTGDLGRYRLDGTVEILGRRDDQVKIRGVRVEPQEVAAVLSTCPEVQMCTVLASRDNQDEIALTAFVVPQPDTSLKGSAMRAYLSARIPSALVPSQYVLLDQFPLTLNGKIDRQALRRLTPTEITKEPYVAPRTADEEQITQIWQKVLQVERIGIHDNFFELGGHSLLATQIMSRVREAFAVTLPLRMLFEAPTVAGFAAALRQHEELSPTDSRPPIRPLPPGDPFPLSFSQERMWFLYQFAPTSAAYNIPLAFSFHGPIILDALAQAVNEIRRRHAVLRTVFPTVDGYPVPQIHRFAPLSVPVIDFQDCSDETRDAEVWRFATVEAKRPFDMAQGPLMRVTFVRMQAEHVLVLLTLHHIIADGWSAGIFRRELETLYEAFAFGQPSPFDELPIQYQDFAAWQRGWLQGEALDTQLTYWTKRLAGAPMILDLPHDRPRGAMQTFAGRRHVVGLSPALTVGLTQLTQREGVTLFMTLLASLSIQLGRYTASDDLLVGVPIANRHFLAIEGLIGTFVNTLVLRTKLEGNPTFLELLHQVRHTTLEAYAHQDLPFEVLVEALNPPRDLSRSPVFQVMLSVLNFQQLHTIGKKKLTGTLNADRQAAQFDLTVAVAERPDHRHSMAWTYNSDLFEHATIVRMGQQFVRVLEEVVAQPHRRIHDLMLLPDHERQQVVVDWNATAQPRIFPGQCLPALLETQANQQPDSIAVVFEGQAVTYGHLNQRANQLAHYLRTLGVGPDVRVAVYCERSLDMILALWGIVKAGGTYVPLDPTYPHKRVALMLEDAEVAVVVAQQRSQTTLPPHAAKVVWIDADWAAIGQGSVRNPTRQVAPENLVYMIYTSGSTGKPKGVQIPHRALMNFLETMACEPGMDASDRLLAVTSLSFDIAGLELFLPVMVGGQVVLASREMAANGAQLMAYLNAEAITVMQATPVTWQLLLAQGWKGQPGLRVLCGGEQMSLDMAKQLLDGGQCLWNLYGPTETTIWSTVSALYPRTQRISIGRPIANTQGYLQDPWGHPVPIGVPGELCIGGEGVARGYWRRSDITAQQFVPDPYNSFPGARMYRTGDIARYRADGTLEWLARKDHQIKLRGYRIELGEIEALLRQQANVQEAVVLIREEGVEDRRLVAYINMAAGHSFDQVGLRESLQQHLPAYMVPWVFVGVEAFPLTPNGKIDRKALPAPDGADFTQRRCYVAPRTVLEEIIVEVWQEVLKVERIGIHDNFFELGGHSLLATRVIARLRNVLNLDIPLRSLFEYPVIARLAMEIDVRLADIFPDGPKDGS